MAVNYGTVTNSFWDSTLATSPYAASTAFFGTGLTTAQMQDLNTYASTYSGWDFANVWAPPNQAGQGGLSTAYYPQLYATSHIAVITAGSESQVYGSSPAALNASIFGLRWYDGSAIALNPVTAGATAGSNVGTYATNVTRANVPAFVEGTSAIQICDSTCSGGGHLPSGTLGINGVSINIDTNSSGQSAVDAINAAHVPGLAPATLVGGKLLLRMSDNSQTLTIEEIGTQSTQANGQTILQNYLGLPGTFYVDGNYYVVTFNSGPPPAAVPSADGATYRLLTVPGAVTVTPEPITVTANAGQSKVYGTADPTLAYTVTNGTLYNGNTLSGALSRASGENVRNYTITEGTLGGLSSNYTIDFVSNTFAITAATLTITANGGQSKVFGTNDPTLTYGQSGLVSGVTVDGVTINDTISGALSRAGYGTAAGENVGSYAITRGSLMASSNYTVSLTPGVDLAITKAPLTITANSGQSKTYGTSDPTLTYGQSGLITGVTVDGVTINGGFTGALSRAGYGTLAGENVDSYAITQGTLTAGTKYNLSLTPGVNFAINQAALTITANSGQSKVYGTNDPTHDLLGPSGLVNGVTVDGVTINDSFAGALSRAGYGTAAGENVGSYAITQGTLTAGTNYSLSFTSGVNFAISRAPLTITANSSQSKTYGTNDPTLLYGQSGLVGGVTVDGVTINDTISGALSRAGYGTAAGENVGGYAITQGTLTASSNYSLAFTPGINFTINQAALTVTANSGQSKVYGTNDPTLTYGQTGLVNGVTVDGVTINDSFTGALSRVGYGTAAGENVGGYAITQGTLTAGTNYTLSLTPGVNFAINQAALTITANSGQSKVYGTNDPTLTYGQSGLVNGVTVDGVTINDSFTGALSRVGYGTAAGENVGSYPITQGTLLASSNYSLAFTSGVNFAISQAPLTITANSGQSKVYGTNDPTLLYGQSGLVNGVTVDGITINDTLTGALSRAGYGTPAGENFGSYAVTQGTLLASSNYSLAFTPGINFSINQAALTVTANSGQSKIYGTNDPTLTYGQSGLVNGVTVDGVTINDSFTGALSRAGYGTQAGENVGSYAITQGTLLASSNYSLSFTPGIDFTIAQALLTVTPNSGQSKIYGTNYPTLAYGQSGLVKGVTVDGVTINDSFTGALSRVGFGTPAGENVGSYAITRGTLTAGTNYNLLFTPGVNFAINPATLTYVANPASRDFGFPNQTFSGTVTGFVNNETQATATAGTLLFTSPTDNTTVVGNYPINGSGLTANNGNYVFVQAPGNATALTINAQRPDAPTSPFGHARRPTRRSTPATSRSSCRRPARLRSRSPPGAPAPRPATPALAPPPWPPTPRTRP